MLQLDGNLTASDAVMVGAVRESPAASNFASVTAGDVRGTGDYLSKILGMIRGCGFAVAIFSDRTPPKTLANIFFEVGMAGVLGKPVQLVLTGENPAPSDFVRSEWIAYRRGEDAALRVALGEGLARIDALAAYYRTIGEVALEAAHPDLELAFERFKQAILIGNDMVARDGIANLRNLLAAARAAQGDDDMASHRERLYRAVAEFMRLLPPVPLA